MIVESTHFESVHFPAGVHSQLGYQNGLHPEAQDVKVRDQERLACNLDHCQMT